MSTLTSKRSTFLGAALYLFIALIALGPLSSKILGAAWLFFGIWGCWLGFKKPTTAVANEKTIVLGAASVWLNSCVISLLLAGICVFIWQEQFDVLNAQLRLLLPAVATLFLVRRSPLSAFVRMRLIDSLALACIVAFAWTLFLTQQGQNIRISLTSNAIPWAVVISFYTCLLLPAALAQKKSGYQRWIWFFGVFCGLGAVLLSQSRGAFLIIPWCVLVYTWFWYQQSAQAGAFRQALLRLSGAIAVVLICAWFVPGDILRMHQAAQDIQQVQTSENYNTSMGARLYLWDLAWQGIQQSPWIGVGTAERIHRIKHAGDGTSPQQQEKLEAVRALNHVHNQYLHSALDGGLIGLTALLTLSIGLAVAIFRLAPTAPTSAWQLGGVLFMHTTSGFTNVNLLHNYYVIALSLAAVIPLLCTKPNSTAENTF